MLCDVLFTIVELSIELEKRNETDLRRKKENKRLKAEVQELRDEVKRLREQQQNSG